MSGRLDQSLQSIIDTSNKAKREARRRKTGKPKGAISVPVGGVKKATKPVKSALKPNAGQPRQQKLSKIVVSGLPLDVTAGQIKEYFKSSTGSVRSVSLHYNHNGQSRGIADIVFNEPDLAAKAAREQNGMLVDKKPMKIEVVVGAGSVPDIKPAKSLAERVAANPKAQPKSATNVKKANAKDGAKGRAAGNQKSKRARNIRPKKTAEELDAEMTDYWGASNPSATGATTSTATNGAAPAATAGAGDEAMDEIQ